MKKSNELFIHAERHFAHNEKGEYLIYLYFSGNTYDHKDAIKELGFEWGEEEMPSSIPIKKVWKKVLPRDKAKLLAPKILAMGAIGKR